MQLYAGKEVTIIESDTAQETYRSEILSQNSSQGAGVAKLSRLIERLGDRGKLNHPDQMRTEGDGFYAIKANGLRAYGWYANSERSIFVISHYIYKKQQKLKKADKDKMKRTRENYERESHE